MSGIQLDDLTGIDVENLFGDSTVIDTREDLEHSNILEFVAVVAYPEYIEADYFGTPDDSDDGYFIEKASLPADSLADAATKAASLCEVYDTPIIREIWAPHKDPSAGFDVTA